MIRYILGMLSLISIPKMCLLCTYVVPVFFFIFANVFRYLCNNVTLEMGWRRRFFNFVNVFSLFHNYPPLEKGGVLHLNKLESPSSKDTLCQVWLKLAQWF